MLWRVSIVMNDVSKDGCYIVIVIHSDGERSIVYEWNEVDCCENAQFRSEAHASNFVLRARKARPDAIYYSKYVSWNGVD